jgi:Putative Ig domain
MTSIYSRGAVARRLAGLVLIGALSACGSSGDGGSIAPKPPTATPLSVSTSSLPQGQVGANYSTPLAATGGTPPYHWSLASGALPAGLTLAASGTITGTPSAATNANAALIGLKVTDSGSPAQSSTRTLSLTIAPSALVVTTTSLAGAQVGKAYTATLTATGGTPPLTWSIAAGSLPAGLSLTPSSGVIAGTPQAAVNSDALTFAVADSSVPMQQKTVDLALTVASSNISIAISPRAAALTLGQTIRLSVTTNDPAGVTWSLTPAGGSFAPVQSANGTSTTFTAPGTAGTYTITATSITNPAQSNTVALGVTDLAGVFTYRNDGARDAVNAQEYALTAAGSGGTGGSVGTATFGKLFSCIADGAVYAQPLWAANLTINGAVHNVVFVASAHDSLYAFDADANPCVQLWSVSLIDTAHGANSGEVTVPSGTTGHLVGVGYGDITPEVGVIGTPVIDSSSGTLYVVSKSMDPTGTNFYQRLHAIDVTTGSEKAHSPVLIQGTFPGSGDKTTTTTFSARQENQRAGLALISGTVYVAWAAHEDASPYYGWLMGYTYGSSGFTQVSVLNVTPNVQYGGIWMGGGAPSVDANGHLYVITGNGGFDANSSSAPNNDYGDSLLQLSVAPNPTTPSAAFTVSQYFTPQDQASDDSGDQDFGAGGAAVLANVTSGAGTVGVVVGGGKDGSLYILNQAALGGFNSSDATAWQKIMTGYHIFSTVSMWNDTIYLGPFNGPLTSYALQTTTTPSRFVQQAQTTDPASFGFPGPSPAISATGTTNGVVWALDNSQYCTNQSQGCGPAVLHAYDATSLAELWNSSMAAGGADTAGNAVKFTVPAIANGKVYIGTRGNNTGGALGSTSVAGELDVYGLQPN